MEVTTMNTTGFIILDKVTGEELATLPLTIPIGNTVQGFRDAGYSVSWTWKMEEM
jgi:hypothetical protein